MLRTSRIVASLALVFALVSGAQAGLLTPLEDAFIGPPVTFQAGSTAAASCAGSFLAGAAAVDVTPGVRQPDGSYALWMEPFEDLNGNGVYDAPDPLDMEATFENPPEPFTDENLNGKWDGPFMAGYGHEKENNEYYVAEGVHDPVWARAVAVTCGRFTLGLVSVDTVGLFRGFVTEVRAEANAAFDHVVVASTHTHDSIDTMGLWGPSQLIDGKDPRTMAHVKEGILAALEGALARQAPVVAVQTGSGLTRDLIPVAGTVQTDLRDPFVVDDRVVATRLVGADGGTLATIINWSPHPETLAGTRSEISSDYAHYLREAIESQGAVVGCVRMEPVGGTAVFFSGAVGGMMTTLGARPLDEQSNPLPDYSYEKTARIGEVAAWVALDALADAPLQPVDGLRVQTREVNVVADNPFLMALNAIGVLDHEVYVGRNAVPPVGPTGVVAPVPFLRAETNVITLTSDGAPILQALAIPGELLPEVALGNPLRNDAHASLATCFAFNPQKLLFNGGREGKIDPATGQRAPGFERVLASKPAYPAEPPVARMATAPHVMMLGLANDELGYIVPANDFEPATLFPGVYSHGRDRCGDSDHYEETNSASSLLAPAIANSLAQMLDPFFAPEPLPKLQYGFLDENGESRPLVGADTRGFWLDTSRSGGYEAQEDAHAHLNPPSGLPACWGFLNGHAQDIGQAPNAEARGFWVDMDGDCAPSPADGVLFADAWALSEGQPLYRP